MSERVIKFIDLFRQRTSGFDDIVHISRLKPWDHIHWNHYLPTQRWYTILQNIKKNVKTFAKHENMSKFSFLNTDFIKMVQVVEIAPGNFLMVAKDCLSCTFTTLVADDPHHREPVHQQQRCWPTYPGIFHNAVHFLQNHHKRHPIARPLGRVMGCLLWDHTYIHILPQSPQWCV